MPVDIQLPGRVWDDFLNPDVSTMEAEYDLPRREHVKRGRGSSVIYRGVPDETASEIAEYLDSRAATLLAQSVADPYDPFEKAARDTYRSARVSAYLIRQDVAR